MTSTETIYRYYSGQGQTNRTTKVFMMTCETLPECWFSYNTRIAFRGIDNVIYLSDRKYSTTTSKHTTWLKRHSFPLFGQEVKIIPDEEFQSLYEKNVNLIRNS